MRRVSILALIFTALITFAPARADASPVQCFAPSATCSAIGEFAWTRDDIFGDVFAVNNLSAGGLAGNLSSITVTTDVGASAFSPDPLAPGNSAEANDLFFGTTTANLTFLLGGGSFTASLLESALVTDDAQGNAFASTLVYAELRSTGTQPVPEPATLLLLASGAGLSRLAARRRARSLS